MNYFKKSAGLFVFGLTLCVSDLSLAVASTNAPDNMASSTPTGVAITAPVSPSWNRHAGAYVEGNVGTMTTTLKFLWIETSRTGGAGNINLGYLFLPYFGLEVGAGIMHFGSTGDETFKEDTIYSTDLVLKGILPLGERFNLFGKIGSIAYSGYEKEENGHVQHNARDIDPYFGIGGAYALTSRLDLTVQWNRSFEPYVDVDFLTVGLTYHF